ncbi:zinc-binding metallopeptidase family protein [Parahaliea aestuarii]|uniref:Zinc-ribbon domain-containing protein n=1 Tax=Parahaliea aestuarii TaxID=1852021 RepID=A0A5C8ZN31_9GAMM|nr:putative zinc-binding metallopeptidase [Parahaliea aestuarii]TXS89164.1 hypothetical protein FVW59_18750 [Parahaliea aestuarii]
MKRFRCRCGQAVFFDNALCSACGATLGFDPGSMDMLALQLDGEQWLSEDGASWRLCSNGRDFAVCNWLVAAAGEESRCLACQFNRTVPNTGVADNAARWARMEQAKKRLLFTLLELGLPLETLAQSPQRGLAFDFVEDERSGHGFTEGLAHTGYAAGVITINLLEADDVAREAQRQSLQEDYRTVLGHLRHESGHYFWQYLQAGGDIRGAFRELFGEESVDYAGALQAHYEQGPPPDWSSRYISAYASAHPSEDWAESWGHYLHIYDALETAAAYDLIDQSPAQMSMPRRIECWRELSVSLNELNRSAGLADAYPFVLNTAVEMKLSFVDRVIALLQTPR